VCDYRYERTEVTLDAGLAKRPNERQRPVCTLNVSQGSVGYGNSGSFGRVFVAGGTRSWRGKSVCPRTGAIRILIRLPCEKYSTCNQSENSCNEASQAARLSVEHHYIIIYRRTCSFLLSDLMIGCAINCVRTISQPDRRVRTYSQVPPCTMLRQVS